MIRIALLLALFASQAAASELTVRVTGAVPGQGQLLISLFATEPAWMKSPSAKATVAVEPSGQGVVMFPRLAPGRYGVSVVYDEDRDGKLDVNFLGIPTESFGFSNDASALFGPPDWSAAVFQVTGGANEITIRLDRAN